MQAPRYLTLALLMTLTAVSVATASDFSRAAYRISVRVIPLGSADGTVVASVDRNWCETRLAEINAIFASANVEFVLGSLERLRADDGLNVDIPAGQATDGIETRRQRLAEMFPSELVVFVRRWLGDQPGRQRFYKSFHYSSVLADYVVAEPGSDRWMLAHEFGHFFGLHHTFDDGLKDKLVEFKKDVPSRIKYLSDLLSSAIADGQVSPDNALSLLDGDRGTISDTPADVAPPLFQPNDAAGEEAGPGSPVSVTIPVSIR
jgi:pregnancy-associated plasma protein-A